MSTNRLRYTVGRQKYPPAFVYIIHFNAFTRFVYPVTALFQQIHSFVSTILALAVYNQLSLFLTQTDL